MCGIAGAAFPNIEAIPDGLTSTLLSIQRHRGPDQEGAWSEDGRNLVFVHSRLSIIDLSNAGKQPMLSANNRYVICYNGEIYNFQDLRREMSDYPFRGRSDTEVILACIQKFGVRRSVCMFNGMFSIALYDRQEKRIYLVRDRIGEKPLYFWCKAGKLIFASEQRAIEETAPERIEVDLEGLSQYFQVGYISAPRTIYKNIRKVEPGHIVSFDVQTDGVVQQRDDSAYWSLLDHAIGAGSGHEVLTRDSVAQKLELKLRDSVRRQLVADVPVGCFLSGGIDSSLVATLARQESTEVLKTFTIGYEDPRFDERDYAAGISASLGTEHHETKVSDKELIDTVGTLPKIVDDLLANPSIIPNYLLAKFASNYVKVALSGDGGDELFVGYNRYLWFRRVMRLQRLTGGRLPEVAAWIAQSRWSTPLLAIAGRFFSNPGTKLQKLESLQACSEPADVYRRIISYYFGDLPLKKGPTNSNWFGLRGDIPLIPAAQLFDQGHYLPGDNLLKLDRACMAVSLETRLPILDYRLIEWTWKLPTSVMATSSVGKLPLRSILQKLMPNRSYERPKMGFSVPIDQWLRGPLLALSEEAIAESSRLAPYVDTTVLETQKSRMLNGDIAAAQKLWVYLVFYLKVLRR